MARFRSRPSEVEAIQWTGSNADEVYRFVQPAELQLERQVFWVGRGSGAHILAGKDGAQGYVEVPVGHWVVRQPGDLTDHWPVENDYFQTKYEPVPDYTGSPGYYADMGDFDD